jgi:hypothetical protein
MQQALRTAAIAASMLAPIGCAQGAPYDGAGAMGSPGATTGAGPTVSPTSCTPPAQGSKPYTGHVNVSHQTLLTTSKSVTSSAFEPAPATAAPACGGTQVGSCCYESPSSAPPVDGVSAGTIEVKDGQRTLDFFDASWMPGDVLELGMSGGVIDAFSATLVAPAPLSGVSPAFGQTPFVATTRSDLTIWWQPSGEACTQVVFSMGVDLPNAPTLVCTVDDAAGTLTVPGSLVNGFYWAKYTDVMPTIERRAIATPAVANASVTAEVAQVQYGQMHIIQ